MIVMNDQANVVVNEPVEVLVHNRGESSASGLYWEHLVQFIEFGDPEILNLDSPDYIHICWDVYSVDRTAIAPCLYDSNDVEVATFLLLAPSTTKVLSLEFINGSMIIATTKPSDSLRHKVLIRVLKTAVGSFPDCGPIV